MQPTLTPPRPLVEPAVPRRLPQTVFEGRGGQVAERLRSFVDALFINGEELFIIQHPAGETKQISMNECAVSRPVADGRAAATDFAHTCDTLGGSSGSPVFTTDGRLVGLHHYGRGVGYWNENRAVRIPRILDAGVP